MSIENGQGYLARYLDITICNQFSFMLQFIVLSVSFLLPTVWYIGLTEEDPAPAFDETFSCPIDDNETMASVNQSFPVPNIVHYVWLRFQSTFSIFRTRKHEFSFYEYLSILSVHKFMKPDRIYFHTDIEPSGKYWNLLTNLTEFKVRKLDRTRYIDGVKVRTPGYDNQASDLERVRILMEEGGVYLDTDVIVLKSFDGFRQYTMTMGEERPGVLCNAIIVAKKEAPFLPIWLSTFVKDFRPGYRAYNAVVVSIHLPELTPMGHDRRGYKFKYEILNTFSMIMPTDEYPGTLLTIRQHWLKQWVGA